MVTHREFSFLSHRVYGARNSLHSPESHNTLDLTFTCIFRINVGLPEAKRRLRLQHVAGCPTCRCKEDPWVFSSDC